MVGDQMTELRLSEYDPPIQVKKGGRLEPSITPWAKHYSMRLPAMNTSFEEWQKHVTPEWAARLRMDIKLFGDVRSRGKLEEERTIFYALEAGVGETRLCYLISEFEMAPGQKGRVIEIFKFVDGEWLAHGVDDLKIIRLLGGITNLERLKQKLLAAKPD
jgi:hypothetical protein